MMQTNHSIPSTILLSLLLLFFIQQVTVFIESIYIQNLLRLVMGSSVLAMLFLISPVLLYFIKPDRAKPMAIMSGFMLVVCHFTAPLVESQARIIVSGLGVAFFMIFLGLSFSIKDFRGSNWLAVLALGTLMSIAFRASGSTLDISITGKTVFIGRLLGMAAALLLLHLARKTGDVPSEPSQKTDSNFLNVPGFFSCVILIYFAFSGPGVISRWTGSSYSAVHIILSFSFLAVLFSADKLRKAGSRTLLLVWNVLFVVTLIFIISANSITPPASPGAAPVIVMERAGPHNVLVFVMLILSPVIFINGALFSGKIVTDRPSRLALPFTVSALVFIVLILMLIFTNVWGYAGPISRIFRNRFYLPFLLAGLGMILPFIKFDSGVQTFFRSTAIGPKTVVWFGVAAFGLTCTGIWLTGSAPKSVEPAKKELTLMTYNIQQGVDYFGRKNYDGQLRVIRKVDPDILCLQESDVARISGGNGDVVRYFADHLDYYSYYGPRTVTGTYGTAILSRYPLYNSKSIFTYSDRDEIGTAFAQVCVHDIEIAIFSNHPAGSDASKAAHVDMLMNAIDEYEFIICMGDYNFDQNSPFYKRITAKLTDSWRAIWPDAVGNMRSEGIEKIQIDKPGVSSGDWADDYMLDMTDRIDHIFLSPNFRVLKSVYLPAPGSQSDHPAHWAVVSAKRL